MFKILLLAAGSVILFVQTTNACNGGHIATINTIFGPVRGCSEYTRFERTPFYSFKGIPYARPPLGSLRFLPPITPFPWRQPLDCFEFGNICMQGKQTIRGHEDCLYLNVFTPNLYPPKPLAVMFYIHGGAWYNEHGNVIGPDFLLEEQVIVVTINYRLGPFGFVSLGTPTYSGNQGLKDQQAALKWVSQNIDRFGGDRAKITMFGDSAGSMSSVFHMWSPGSRGLYRRAIEISFTFDVWSIAAKPHHRADMFEFAHRQNATIASTKDLVGFLQYANADDIIRAFPFKFYNNIIMPTIESKEALLPFSTATPSELMLETDNFQSNVDVMTGWTTAEALFLASSDEEITVQNYTRQMRLQLPSIHFNGAYYDSDEYRQVAAEITDFYHPNATVDELMNMERLKSDVYIRYFIDQRVKLLAKKSSGRTYYYRFGAETLLNFFKSIIGGRTGASHGDDLCYISPCNFFGRSLNIYKGMPKESREGHLIKVMAGMYADFAKYGHPFVGRHRGAATALEAVRPHRCTFVDITNTGALVGGVEPFLEQSKFWSRLLSEHPALLDLYL